MAFQYFFNYNDFESTVVFEVTEQLTSDKALSSLEFHRWEYPKNIPVIDALLKKYARVSIEVAKASNLNEYELKKWFNNAEGFLPVDGSEGILLKMICASDYFDEEKLHVQITTS